MVGGLDKSDGGWWHVVANGACGMNNGLHGGGPLYMVDHLDNVNWCRIWEWVEMGWWTQWVKMRAVVVVTVPGGLYGGAGS